MQWVLDLFDKHKVSHPRRHRPLQGVRHRPGLDLLDRPVDAQRLCPAEAATSRTDLFPKIGDKHLTYFEEGGLELYAQKDTGRHEATMQAVKWLSDNSFLWTTVGRGASPRKSILERPDYKTAGLPWDVRGAFVDGMSFATLGEIPVLAGPDFTIYSGGNFLAKTLEGVWTGQSKPEEAMAEDRGAVAEGSRRRLSAHRRARRSRPGRRCVGICASRPRSPRSPPCRGAIDRSGYLFVAFFTIPFLLFNITPIFFGIYRRVHRVGHRRSAHLGRAANLPGGAGRRLGRASPSSTRSCYALIIVPGVIFLGLLFALFVHQRWPLATLARTLFFTPNVVSATVIGLVWVWLLDTQFGLVNQYLGLLGIHRSPG